MMLAHQLTMEEVNSLESESFVRIFGNIVDHFPAGAIAILKNRPFSDINDFVRAIVDLLDSLKAHEKERILQLHPDTVNKLIYSSQLTLESEIVVNDHLSIEEQINLKELHSRYKTKFEFSFIIDEKEEDVNAIFSEIGSRLKNTKEQEIENAIEKVKNIVKLRIHEIVR